MALPVTGDVNDPLYGMPTGAAQLAKLCADTQAAGDVDAVTNAFCGATPATVNGLQDLQGALNLSFAQGRQAPSFAVTGHSSSLVLRQTNALNPRAVLFTRNGTRTNIVTMGYVRGEQAAELIAKDNNRGTFNFYFVKYKNACNDAGACTNADIMQAGTEKGWTEYSIYRGADLENTQLDCTQCHIVDAVNRNAQQQAPAGGAEVPAQEVIATRQILRMQELQNPWTHFMRDNTQGGQAIIADFQAAHGTAEAYAGIPGNRISASEPANLETFVRGQGSGNQPNEFRTANIEGQVRNSSAAQPRNNDTPGTSATWEGLYQGSLEGRFIPVPYHDVKITDSKKVASMTANYKEVAAGTLEGAQMQDLRTAFRDDRLQEIAMINVKADMTDGQALITAACTQCHRSQLNQTITRSRFNADLGKFSDLKGGVMAGADRDKQLRVVINRLHLPAMDVKKMPPERFRTLSPAQIDTMTKYLCSQMATPDADCAASK